MRRCPPVRERGEGGEPPFLRHQSNGDAHLLLDCHDAAVHFAVTHPLEEVASRREPFRYLVAVHGQPLGRADDFQQRVVGLPTPVASQALLQNGRDRLLEGHLELRRIVGVPRLPAEDAVSPGEEGSRLDLEGCSFPVCEPNTLTQHCDAREHVVPPEN